MTRWQQALRAAVVSGGVASLVSLAGLALFGRAETGRAFGPVNAPSHWLWGDVALRNDGASFRYTAIGVVVHHLSSMFWGAVHAGVFGVLRQPPPALLRDAALTTAFAAWVDLRLVPRRLGPGFEGRLSSPGLGGVYLLFALGLAGGHHLAARRQDSRQRVRSPKSASPGPPPPA
jgi:hypothetical protein